MGIEQQNAMEISGRVAETMIESEGLEEWRQRQDRRFIALQMALLTPTPMPWTR